MINIAIDAMGGDFSVNTTVKGSMLACKEFKDIELYLYGDESKIKPLLLNSERIHIVNTPKFMSMGEHDPVGYLRRNKDCSMALAMSSLKDKKCDACVSAGPTQCVIVGAHLFVRKLQGMSRVALCPIIPSLDGKGRILLDVGANVELRSEHLRELAICASIVSKEVLNVRSPKVGLLNIGTEEGKGREIDQETFKVLKDAKEIAFFGNVETKDILTTKADVLLTDGFTGNMVLKTMEGTAKGIGEMLKNNIKASPISLIGALFMHKALKNFKKSMDSSEIGGAMILGAKAPVIKAHGSSSPKAFKNAIRQARLMVINHVVEKIKEDLPQKEE